MVGWAAERSGFAAMPIIMIDVQMRLYSADCRLTVEKLVSLQSVYSVLSICHSLQCKYNLYQQPSSTVSSLERSHERKRRDANQIMSTADTSFSLNKARYEVRQLGIKGMCKESKEDAIMHKLIQLGAKVNNHYIHCSFFTFSFTVFVNIVLCASGRF